MDMFFTAEDTEGRRFVGSGTKQVHSSTALLREAVMEKNVSRASLETLRLKLT